MVFYRIVLLVLSIRVQIKRVAVNGSQRSSRQKVGVLLWAPDSGVLLLWLWAVLSSPRLFLCVSSCLRECLSLQERSYKPCTNYVIRFVMHQGPPELSKVSSHCCLSAENRDLLPEFHIWPSDGRQKEVTGSVEDGRTSTVSHLTMSMFL